MTFNLPSSFRHAATAVAVALMLVPALGCAQSPSAPRADKPAGAQASREGAAQGLTAEMMYRLLVADVALQRGDTALAARAYYEAARDSRDARIARRATEVALAARQRALALDSARLWSELEPKADRPKQVIAGLSSGASINDGRAFGSDMQAELERALAEAGGGPRLAEAFLQLNRLLSNEPDKLATFKLVRTLAQPYPNVAEANFAVALAAYNAGLPDMATTATAMQAVDRALALKPGWEQAILLKVEILAKDTPDRAADYLVELLKKEPDSKAALSALAQVRIQQKRYAEAIAILDKLWQGDKENHEYQFGMAMLAIQMKDWPRAETLFEELKQVDYGEDGVVDFYLAQIAEETNRYALALDRYKAVPEGERGWLAKLRVGLMLGKLGRLDEARDYLGALPAVAIDQQVQVQQTQAQVMRDAGDNTKAYGILVAALDKYPDDPDLLYDTAMVAEKLDKIDVVEQRLMRLIELKPTNAHALNALGYTLVDRTQRTEEGLALVERALVLAPDDPFILDSVGWANYRMGKLDEAEKHLRRALEQRQDPEIAAHLGEVLWVKGDRDEARRIWEQGRKKDAKNKALNETIRRLTT